MAAFDPHVNFGYSTVLVAPTPALSGLTLTVQAGDGAKFPSPSPVAFNAVVWPPGVQPTTTNAEIVRVTGISTDTFTVTRLQESSNNRAIAIGDQICCVLSAKTLTDIENRVIAAEKTWVNHFRVTLTSGTPVTTGDVLAATTIYFSPITGNQIDLPDSAGIPQRYTTSELSIAVPATTSQMYDLFVYSNNGTPTLELLAWTNDTTRATAVVRTTNGRLLKSGDNTRLYVASCRTTGVSGQTEDSRQKRYVWNYYNQKRRALLRQETTASWAYTTATARQANGSTANQVEFVIGVAETVVSVIVSASVSNSNTGPTNVAIGIGENSTTTLSSEQTGAFSAPPQASTGVIQATASLTKMPAIGRSFWAWLEWSQALGTTTWWSGSSVLSGCTSGISGWIEG